MNYPDEIKNFWSLRDDLCVARVRTKVWREMLLNDLDRCFFKQGTLRRLRGKSLGSGVVEITIEPEVPG